MGMSINTNIPSLRASTQTDKSAKDLHKSYEKLASGKEINRASDNPAGLAVAMELLANADSGSVAARNVSDGMSALNIADGALQSASDITMRMQELATQSANGTLSDNQRAQLNNEYQSLKQELDRVSQTTEFNGQKLLGGSTDIAVQAGTTADASSQIGVSLPGISSSSLGLASDISTQAGAKAALTEAKAATQSVAGARAEIGSTESRLGVAYENIKTTELNQRDAASRIMDTDIAKESANMVGNSIRQQAGTAIQAQANNQAAISLKLLT